MNLKSLKHLAKVLEAMVPEGKIIVLGSSAWLVPFPQLGEAGEPLETSLDADAVIESLTEPDGPEMILEALGGASRFQRRYGYHVDLMRPSIGDMFPTGWRDRLLPIPDTERSSVVDSYDVAVAKLRVGRDKDLRLLSGLIAGNLLNREELRERLRQTSLDEKETARTHDRLDEIVTN